MLDIGLPTLNGIEAARRIRKLSPESKILFVSQESSADVVQTWLRQMPKSELLAAVEAVRQGRQFVSEGLAGHVLAELDEVEAPNRLRRDEVWAQPEAKD